MSAPQRTLTIILAIALAGFLARLGYRSVHRTLGYNDFEVFHHAGAMAAAHDPAIYDVPTPKQQRGPFLYPPSAAILFIPLSWLPHEPAAVVFSIVKLACLVALLYGAVRFSGCPPRDSLGHLIIISLTLLTLYRPLDSDIGNGQINILIALMAVGGVWLMTLYRQSPKGWFFGAALISIAIAVKLTPALLLAVPFLHRQWKGLAISIVLSALLLFALPYYWFGTQNYAYLMRRQSAITGQFTLDWAAGPRQITFNEMIQFTRSHEDATAQPDDNEAEAFDRDKPSGAWPEYRPGRAQRTMIWLIGAGAIGGLFLLWRWRLSRHAPMDWRWDLAMMCTLLMLVSPRVQKAHLVILIVPVSWVIARIMERVARSGLWRNAIDVLLLAAFIALFLIAETLTVNLPGLAQGYRPALFAGLLLLILMIVKLRRVSAAIPAVTRCVPGSA